VVTAYDRGYPAGAARKLGEQAPPMLYVSGAMQLTDLPAIALMGVRGVRTSPQLREGIDRLVQQAVRRGYAILTGGEPGVSRVAADAVDRASGVLIDVVAGSMRAHLSEPPVDKLLGEGRCAVLSIEHPDALFTAMHALARNRLLFSMARAAFICNTDGRRGETEALQNRTCGYIYAWTGINSTAPLIQRGAVPVRDLGALDFDEMSAKWEQSESEQISMFDMLGNGDGDPQ